MADAQVDDFQIAYRFLFDNLDRKAGCRYYYDQLLRLQDEKDKNGTTGASKVLPVGSVYSTTSGSCTGT